MKKISIIIPVYNNEKTIDTIYSKIKKIIKSINLTYEIIFIEDGSKDKSYNKIKKICLNDKKVLCVKLSKNFGQRFALMAGLKYCTGNFLINLDADLQDPPELISKIYQELNKGNHIVIAARNSNNENIFKKITSAIQHKILSFLIKDYPEEGFTVFGISRKLINEIKERGNNISLLQLEILNYGYRYKKIFYARHKRTFGTSQFNFSSRLSLAIEMITLTTSSFLRFSLYLGVILLTLSFIYILSVMYSYFKIGTPFEGYSPLIIISLFFGGLNLFILGVLSEYISLIIREIRSYKKFNIEKLINKPKDIYKS